MLEELQILAREKSGELTIILLEVAARRPCIARLAVWPK